MYYHLGKEPLKEKKENEKFKLYIDTLKFL